MKKIITKGMKNAAKLAENVYCAIEIFIKTFYGNNNMNAINICEICKLI